MGISTTPWCLTVTCSCLSCPRGSGMRIIWERTSGLVPHSLFCVVRHWIHVRVSLQRHLGIFTRFLREGGPRFLRSSQRRLLDGFQACSTRRRTRIPVRRSRRRSHLEIWIWLLLRIRTTSKESGQASLRSLGRSGVTGPCGTWPADLALSFLFQQQLAPGDEEEEEQEEVHVPEPSTGTDALASPHGIFLPAPRWSGSALRTRREVLHCWHKETRVREYDLPPLPPE